MAKHPGGRPTKYKPEYCKELIEHMSGGLSYESFAGTVDVCDDTLREWEKVHSEFKQAKKIAFQKNRLFWEKQGIDGLYSTTEYDEKGKPTTSRSINATLWVFNMKNRFPEQWREKREVDVKEESTQKIKSDVTLTGSEARTLKEVGDMAKEFLKNRVVKK